MEMSSFNYQVKKTSYTFLAFELWAGPCPLVTTVEAKQDFLFWFGVCSMKTADYDSG